MGFTKLDDRLLMSSLMREPAETFKVFIAILSACGPDGISRVSVSGLAGACFMSINLVRRAIKTLESPDPDSRTTIEEGRRIRRVDGGFQVINYFKYREWSYSTAKDAVRKRKYRMRIKKTEEKKLSLPLTEAEAEAEAECPRLSRTLSHDAKEKKPSPLTEATRAHNVTEPPVNGIYFDGGEWRGLTPNFLESLREKFPISDINGELKKMAAWILKEPSRDNPNDRTEFIESWLKRPKYTAKN